MPWQCHGYHLDFQSLGFILHEQVFYHPKENHCIPRIYHTSTNKNLSQTNEKKTKINDFSKDILSCNRVNIRKFAKLISNLVNGFPAVKFGLIGV